MNNDDDGGMSPLRVAAIQTHELYSEMVAAGFSRKEAMELVAKVLIGMVSAGMEQANDENKDD